MGNVQRLGENRTLQANGSGNRQTHYLYYIILLNKKEVLIWRIA